MASIGGIRREWDALITEQVPDTCVSWSNIDGATNRGIVTFERIAPSATRVTLALIFEPDGLVESIGDKLGFVSREARGDLERFREFITSRGIETGAWRGEVHNGRRTDSSGAFGAPAVRDADDVGYAMGATQDPEDESWVDDGGSV